MAMPQPKTVKVTVYSARNLKPKKGDGDPLAWIVFGFGKSKCCTAQIRDRNAKWNEESSFTITEPRVPLKLSVKDGNDGIGTVVIPLEEIPGEEHFLKWIPIGPYRKFPNQPGELCIDCWVDEYYAESENFNLKMEQAQKSKKMGKKIKSKLSLLGKDPSPNLSAIRKHLGISNPKGSVSCEDLSFKKRHEQLEESKNTLSSKSFRTSNGHDVMDGRKSPVSSLADESKSEKSSPKRNKSPVFQQIRKSVSTLALTTSQAHTDTPRRFSAEDWKSSVASGSPVGGIGLPVINEQHYPPKVLSCVPTSGPITGGTLVQITGRNLGISREDITRLMVAGCNCLPSLEYYTSNKIMCTTTESVGVGPISMSTRSGGTSSSKIMFEFVKTAKPPDSDEVFNDITDTDSGFGRESGSSESEREKDAIIEELRSQLERTEEEKKELRAYIDKLTVYLLEKFPEALESQKMYGR